MLSNFFFPGTTGDSSGNISWGFNPEDVALFPEIQVNYDVSLGLALVHPFRRLAVRAPFANETMKMYPPKLLPGCRVFIKTSATSDRQARLLLQAMGLPFYGEFVD